MTRTEMGEYLVGAYLEHFEGCHLVVYNAKPPVAGLGGMNELDVVGFNWKKKKVWFCEVSTHLAGLQGKTVARIGPKYKAQKAYAKRFLPKGLKAEYSYWAPYIPKGPRLAQLQSIRGLEIVTNDEYGRRMRKLMERAIQTKRDTGNPAFRTLQIACKTAQRLERHERRARRGSGSRE